MEKWDVYITFKFRVDADGISPLKTRILQLIFDAPGGGDYHGMAAQKVSLPQERT